jgi:hypothetical protein
MFCGGMTYLPRQHFVGCQVVEMQNSHKNNPSLKGLESHSI